MKNTHVRRVNKGIVTRLPGGLWVTLLFLTTLSSFLLGLSAGVHGRRSRIAATALSPAIPLSLDENR